jgi:hypothetical protein
MDVNETVPGIDATEAAAGVPMAPELAQPATRELTDMAPSGNRGALARNLMAWRREEEVDLGMVMAVVMALFWGKLVALVAHIVKRGCDSFVNALTSNRVLDNAASVSFLVPS